MTWAAETDSVPQGDDGLATLIVYHTIEDEARRLADILRDAHFWVVQSSRPADLDLQCEREHADLVLLDIRPGEEDDFEICRRLMERTGARRVSTILMVSAGRSDDLEKAHAAGASEVLLKPIHRVEFVRRVSSVARLAKLRGELGALQAKLARDGATTGESGKRDRD